jgi:signal transduction histidine kinase
MNENTKPARTTLGQQTTRLSRAALSMLLVSAVYYALAATGTALSVPPSRLAIIWPATAFLISVLILTPARRWPLYLLAIVPAHIHMATRFASADLPSVAIAYQLLGNFGLALVTALVVRPTVEPRLRLDTFQGLLPFIVLAGLAVPAAVAVLIFCLHFVTGRDLALWPPGWQWILAGVFPTITIPPLAVAAMRGNLLGHGTTLRRSYVELGLLSIALPVVCILVSGWGRLQLGHLPMLLLSVLPLLLWAAVRLGVGGTSIVLLVFAGTVSAAAASGPEPFVLHSPVADVVSLQLFLIAVSVPLVLLAALAEERTLAAAALTLTEQRLLTLQQEGQHRIAQELHDSTSQHLTAMALYLMILRRRAAADSIAVIDDIRASLKEATRHLRSFGYLLHPAEVHGDGLLSTLHRYVDGFAMRAELQAKVRATSTLSELPLPVQEGLLRIVQESLANVYRHASASFVTVKLSQIGHRLHLVIADDGKGIPCNLVTDDGESRRFGVGIPTMKACARHIGGRLEVRRRPKGMIVHAVIPIRR